MFRLLLLYGKKNDVYTPTSFTSLGVNIFEVYLHMSYFSHVITTSFTSFGNCQSDLEFETTILFFS